MNDLTPSSSIDETFETQELLKRWLALSNFQKRALLGLAHEVQTSSDLIEDSVRELSTCFLELARLVQERRSSNNQPDEMGRLMSQSLSEIITKMQFQDRTSQRLSLIVSTLKVVGDSFHDVGAQTSALFGTEPVDVNDPQWVDQLIEKMHLGEMKERFIRHLLDEETLFDESQTDDTGVAHLEASDDIELF